MNTQFEQLSGDQTSLYGQYVFEWTRRVRPLLHEYVFIENDIVLNENSTIVLHLHIVSYCCHIVLSRPHENDENN